MDSPKKQTTVNTKLISLRIYTSCLETVLGWYYRETRGSRSLDSFSNMAKSNDWMFPIGASIRSFLREKKPVPDDQDCIPYNFACGEGIWKTLEHKTEWKKAFDDNIKARLQAYTVPWHLKFPYAEKLAHKLSTEMRKSITIVDVGGHLGVDLTRFLAHNPDFPGSLVLQDLPKTLEKVGTLDSRVQVMPYDFFTPQPVRGMYVLAESCSSLQLDSAADIYYFKSVLHDWDDQSSIKLLSQTASTMSRESRLLINEMVLPNVGASLDGAAMDLMMYFLSAGIERTLAQWTHLLASVQPKLRIVEVWSADNDAQAVIETILA